MTVGCCPEGSWPVLKAEGERKGSVVTLAEGKSDLAGYVVRPEGTEVVTKGILVFQDIFNFDGGRTTGACDQLAEAGFLVVLPDFVRGNPYKAAVAEYGDLPEWIKPYEWNTSILPDVKGAVLPFFEANSITTAGLVGFCWGALNVFHASADPDLSIFKAGVSCHPSLQLHGWVFGGHNETLDVVKKVNIPQLLMPAGSDPAFVREGGSVIEGLKANGGMVGDESKCIDFPDMQHGWVNRGDIKDEAVKASVKKVMELMVQFLTKFVV